MDALNRIKKEELRDLLGKGWLTHDGMWFFHTCMELGIGEANRLNRAAIKSMAPLEVQRAKKALGFREEIFSSFDQFMDFMLSALELTLPESVFSKVRFTSPSENCIAWEWEKGQCFAYKGMTQMGMIDGYHCGVMYRIECWLETLGFEVSVDPVITCCLMHEKGECQGRIKVRIN
jgi:Family of unknown function (DUF6125)